MGSRPTNGVTTTLACARYGTGREPSVQKGLGLERLFCYPGTCLDMPIHSEYFLLYCLHTALILLFQDPNFTTKRDRRCNHRIEETQAVLQGILLATCKSIQICTLQDFLLFHSNFGFYSNFIPDSRISVLESKSRPQNEKQI